MKISIPNHDEIPKNWKDESIDRYDGALMEDGTVIIFNNGGFARLEDNGEFDQWRVDFQWGESRTFTRIEAEFDDLKIVKPLSNITITIDWED